MRIVCIAIRVLAFTNIYSYTFYFFGGINLLLAVFVIFIVPETRNVVLEEMDTLFGGVNHVEKGEAHLIAEGSHRLEEEDKGQSGHAELEEIAPAEPINVDVETKV